MQTGQLKRVGNCWLLRYYEEVLENGKPVRRRVARKIATYGDRYRTKADVEPLAKEFLAPINARSARPESGDSVLEFIKNIYVPHCRGTLRPSTCKSYRDMFRLIETHLDDIRLCDFTTHDADQLMEKVAREKKRAHTTHRNLKSFLSGAFRFAKRMNAIRDNPIRDAAIPRGRPKGDAHACTLDEINAMLTVLPEPARTLVLVAALTGLRLSEIKGLRWEDFNGSQLLVQRSVWAGHVSEPKTLSSRAAVPILPLVIEGLAKHRSRSIGGGWIFSGSSGKPLRIENTVRREIRPALDKAGLKWYGWHSLRRGLATNLYELRAPDKTVQAILRHANVSTTMAYYVKPVPSESVAAMRRLERAFKQSAARQEKMA